MIELDIFIASLYLQREYTIQIQMLVGNIMMGVKTIFKQAWFYCVIKVLGNDYDLR
jgi:hypothetical protein